MDGEIITYGVCRKCLSIYPKTDFRRRLCSKCQKKVEKEVINPKPYKRKKIDSTKEILEIMKLAEKEHLTYGQYVARHHL